MKACKKFRDLILTDYIDAELDEPAKKEIEAHLASCLSCRSFAESLKNKLVIPLRESKQEPVPQDIWPQIKDRLIYEPAAEAKTVDLWDWLFAPFFSRRLVPVMAGLVVLVLVGSFTLFGHQVRLTKENEQGQYLASMLAAGETPLETEETGFGTLIEEYFL